MYAIIVCKGQINRLINSKSLPGINLQKFNYVCHHRTYPLYVWRSIVGSFWQLWRILCHLGDGPWWWWSLVMVLGDGYMLSFQMLAACVGGVLLSCICRQFALDYAHSAGGLPDLTLWNPKTLECKVSHLSDPYPPLYPPTHYPPITHLLPTHSLPTHYPPITHPLTTHPLFCAPITHPLCTIYFLDLIAKD